ncbi:MAG: sulfite exporter TauE/SafE family protein [Clostridiaceae bacterium]|nr:sulfite exporter TauE/SafE family protein [Clostridiaceae bacterium]
MTVLFIAFVSLAATMIGGISGVGGGVIIKPMLDAVSSMPVETVSFLSGCTVLAMTVTSTIRSRNDEVKIDQGRMVWLAIGAAVGGIAGKELFEALLAIGGVTVSAAQQMLMILLTVGVLIYTLKRSSIVSLNVTNRILCTVIGLFLGILSSFLGIGGGPINLAVLYYFFSMDTKTAALNSLYVILFSQSASFLNTVLRNTIPQFDWVILIAMILCGILGGNLGRSLSRRMSSSAIDKLFIGLLIVITGISCYNLWQCFN